MTSPRLAVATNQGRFYSWRGERYKSVTNILSGGIPKPALVTWAAKRVAEIAVQHTDTWVCMSAPNAVDWLKRGPYRESEQAAVKGSDIHGWAERFALGQPVAITDAPEDHRPYLEGFLRFLSDWQVTIEMTEASVFNRTHRYAGTLDMLVTIGRLPAHGGPLGRLVVDIKTGKGVYPEAAIQQAAYRFAEFVAMPDGSEAPMPDADGAAVLHLIPATPFYELIPVDASHDTFRTFLYVQQVAEALEQGHSLLGSPVTIPIPPPLPTAPPNVAALVD